MSRMSCVQMRIRSSVGAWSKHAAMRSLRRSGLRVRRASSAAIHFQSGSHSWLCSSQASPRLVAGLPLRVFQQTRAHPSERNA